MATSSYDSPAQARMMRAVAHGWKPKNARGKLPSRAVANEFVDVKDRGKPKKMQRGGRPGLPGRGLANPPVMSGGGGSDLGTEPILDADLAPGRGIANTIIGTATKARLAAQGWQLANGKWWPPEGTLGYLAEGESGLGRMGGYALPQAPEPGATAEPGSLADEIYQKYGIVDPTATRYDLTSKERLREDPLAHLAPDDPARQEYEQWDARRELGQPRDLTGGSGYPEPSETRRSNPYRQQLRGHKARIADILSGGEPMAQAGGPGGMLPPGELILDPDEEARGGRVEYQVGGLAQAMQRQRGSMGRRGSPQMMQAMQRRTGRGRPQPGGRMRGNDARRPSPQMMQAMQRKMQQRGGGGPRGMVAPGLRGRPMPGQGRAQPGGPGGQVPGRQPMMSPADAKMPGGRAMPYRGLMQKMRAQGGGQRKQIGMGDQQGGLSRAMQTQTGRPPISRRAAFPGSRQNQY